LQAGNDGIDALDGEQMWRIPGVFAGACRLSSSFDGEWNFTRSSRPLPSGVCTIATPPVRLEPHDAVHPATFDRPLALQHKSELDEELSRGCEVVNRRARKLPNTPIAEGMSVVEVAAQAGHSPTMTLNMYGYVMEELAGETRTDAETAIRQARASMVRHRRARRGSDAPETATVVASPT
jgi:hypothetical protein